jgi:hypothetical protein
MKQSEIEQLWREDSVIDADNLHQEAIRIPQLHGKYHEILNRVFILKKQKELEYKNLYKEKWLYYSGKADEQVYKEKPFPHKIMKSDVGIYIDADEELNKLKYMLDYYGHTIKYLEDILKQIHNRSFQIRDSLEWHKFIAGQ